MRSVRENVAIIGFILIHLCFDYRRNAGEVPHADKPWGEGFQGDTGSLALNSILKIGLKCKNNIRCL